MVVWIFDSGDDWVWRTPFATKEEVEAFWEGHRSCFIIPELPGRVAPLGWAEDYGVPGNGMIELRENPDGTFSPVGEIIFHGYIERETDHRYSVLGWYR